MDHGTLNRVCKSHMLFRRLVWTCDRQDSEDCLDYVRAWNQASHACHKAKKQLEAARATEAKKNSGHMFFKAKTSTQTDVADLRKDDGTKTTSD